MMYRCIVLSTALVIAVTGSGCGSDSPSEPIREEEDTPPRPLDIGFTTNDPADVILVTSTRGNLGESITLCLEVSSESGWWKGVGVSETQPTLETDGAGGSACMTTNAGIKTLTFWKAKVFGVHTQVGSGSLDLSEYAGHKIDIEWTQD